MTTRTVLGDPFEHPDNQAVLRAAADAARIPAGTTVPVHILEGLADEVREMIETHEREVTDPRLDASARVGAAQAAFGQRRVLERVLNIIADA